MRGRWALSPEFILAWANVEGSNADASGPGRAAESNNNYFGLTFGSARESLSWTGSIACPPGSYVGRNPPGGHACFGAAGAFFVSGMAALTDQRGRYGRAGIGVILAGGQPDEFGAIGASALTKT